jgi:poly(3-hydroxyalkanoate) synthetase
MFAMLKSTASIAASPNWSADWPMSSEARESLRQIAVTLGGSGANANAFPEAVLQRALRQDQDLVAGIAAYRRHPFQRDMAEPPTFWQEGNTRLLDYGARGANPALSAVFVPSLINRAYILDLVPGRSMMRALAARGMRPLLLDWGWPDDLEKRFTLTDYIAGRLERALAAVAASAGPVLLVGFCMGGLLALAAALRRPDLVRGLALLATPWDFHAVDAARAQMVVRSVAMLEPVMQLTGTLPIDLVQTLFALVDPYAIAAKYRRFARLDLTGRQARLFVALEDWLNDGVPLAAPVARECLTDWYGANRTARLQWQVAGLPVDPAALQMPCFIAVPSRDRIVPPESAHALADAMPHAVLHEPGAGHISMVAGAAADTALWSPLMAWARDQSRGGK